MHMRKRFLFYLLFIIKGEGNVYFINIKQKILISSFFLFEITSTFIIDQECNFLLSFVQIICNFELRKITFHFIYHFHIFMKYLL